MRRKGVLVAEPLMVLAMLLETERAPEERTWQASGGSREQQTVQEMRMEMMQVSSKPVHQFHRTVLTEWGTQSFQSQEPGPVASTPCCPADRRHVHHPSSWNSRDQQTAAGWASCYGSA